MPVDDPRQDVGEINELIEEELASLLTLERLAAAVGRAGFAIFATLALCR